MALTLQERTALILKEQGIKQRDLVVLTGATKGLIGQWINGPAKTMSYTHAKPISAKYGYALEWLMQGKEPKLDKRDALTVREPAAEYGLKADALEVARLWSQLAPHTAMWIRDLIYITHLGETRYPWLRRGRPKGETYAQWEKRMQESFYALTALEMQRGKK